MSCSAEIDLLPAAVCSTGLLLVRYYGEHSSMYVRQEDCELPPADESEHLAQLKAVARQQNK